LELQRRCLEVALKAIEDSDAVIGCFLWKWFPGEARGEDFLVSRERLRKVIGARWTR
jgi:hypothetical protein